jgi:hypothetical protein
VYFSIKTEEELSKLRAEGMNRNIVEGYFQLVKEVKEELQIEQNPNKLFNMDTTGLVKSNSLQNTFPQRGRKCGGNCKDTNVEHGENVAVDGCCWHLYPTPQCDFRRRKYCGTA